MHLSPIISFSVTLAYAWRVWNRDDAWAENGENKPMKISGSNSPIHSAMWRLLTIIYKLAEEQWPRRWSGALWRSIDDSMAALSVHCAACRIPCSVCMILSVVTVRGLWHGCRRYCADYGRLTQLLAILWSFLRAWHPLTILSHDGLNATHS